MWLITSSISLDASAVKLAAWNELAPLGFLLFLGDTFPCSCSRTLSLKCKRNITVALQSICSLPDLLAPLRSLLIPIGCRLNICKNDLGGVSLMVRGRGRTRLTFIGLF